MKPSTGRALADVCRSLISDGETLPDAKALFEDHFVTELLASVKGNITHAARKGGVHRNTIHTKVRMR